MKTCFKCQRSLPLEEFYRHPQMADGHLGKCKDCTKRDVGMNRVARHEKYVEYDRVRGTGARAERSARASAEWEARHPEARRAHSAVARAVRAGTLVRRPCEVCGAAKVLAHHDDYTKPLDVRWLCQSCHKSHHAAVDGCEPWRLKSLGAA